MKTAFHSMFGYIQEKAWDILRNLLSVPKLNNRTERWRWRAPQKNTVVLEPYIPQKYEKKFKGFLYPAGG